MEDVEEREDRKKTKEVRSQKKVGFENCQENFFDINEHKSNTLRSVRMQHLKIVKKDEEVTVEFSEE